MAERKGRYLFICAFLSDDRRRESRYLRLFSGRCPTRKKLSRSKAAKKKNGGSEDRPQCAEPSRPAQVSELEAPALDGM